MNKRSGSASTKLTALVIETYGNQCWLQLPGCRGLATTKDHIIPVDHNGDDSLENLRPACQPCNSRRQNLAISGTGGITVTVLVGPPAGGKNTYVQHHSKPGDVLIDLDALANALQATNTPSPHEYPQHVRNIAIGARQAALQRALRTRYPCNVFVIHAVPRADQLQQYARLRYKIITCDPGRATVEARARAARPLTSLKGVARWYDRYPEGEASVQRIANRRPVSSAAPPATRTEPQEPSRAW